jgi:uncharacterized protein DUF3298
MMKRFLFTVFAILIFGAASLCAIAQTKDYRGEIGNSHIQMRLNFNGSAVTGTYFYDSVGEELKLKGQTTAQGGLELKESDAKGKETGKFVCKHFNDPIDAECAWTRTDGTHESMVSLEPQYLALTNGLEIHPKTIANKKAGVVASYPELFSKAPLGPAARDFNRRILEMVQTEIKKFSPVDGRGAFDANYNVLMGTNDLISVEVAIYYDGGGAHPNNYFLSLTYDLAANKELKYEDLFQPGADYDNAIARYLVADIDKRAYAVEQKDATDPKQVQRRDEPIISQDQLTELTGWGLTPKGLVVYFDFPHVIAYFDKNIVPYSVVKQYLKPNSPAARWVN